MTFPCDECESIFKEKRNLMQHIKNHHGLKKFKCNFCDYRSNDRKTLKRHENDKHKHELFKGRSYLLEPIRQIRAYLPEPLR